MLTESDFELIIPSLEDSKAILEIDVNISGEEKKKPFEDILVRRSLTSREESTTLPHKRKVRDSRYQVLIQKVH